MNQDQEKEASSAAWLRSELQKLADAGIPLTTSVRTLVAKSYFGPNNSAISARSSLEVAIRWNRSKLKFNWRLFLERCKEHLPDFDISARDGEVILRKN